MPTSVACHHWEGSSEGCLNDEGFQVSSRAPPCQKSQLLVDDHGYQIRPKPGDDAHSFQIYSNGHISVMKKSQGLRGLGYCLPVFPEGHLIITGMHRKFILNKC